MVDWALTLAIVYSSARIGENIEFRAKDDSKEDDQCSRRQGIVN